MNYYPHHIGDYLRDTVHLSATEDGLYRRMLDVYYASEKPLPLEVDMVCRLVRANNETEREFVRDLLNEFFQKCDDGWRNKRADLEIRAGRKRAKVARINGKLGGRPKTQRVSRENPVGSRSANLQVNSQKPKAKDIKEAEPPPIGGTVWDLALPLLAEQGLKEQSARAFVGSCLRDWDAAAVESAFRSAAGKVDAKSYVLGVLKQTPKKGVKQEWHV